MKNIYLTTLFLVLFALPAWAQDKKEAPLTPHEQVMVDTLTAAVKASTQGPAPILLLNEAVLNLPAGYIFIPREPAIAYMKLIGNHMGPEFIGMVSPQEHLLNWFITIDYNKSGYIKDDDAKKWNADDLLEDIKEGNEHANKQRAEEGFPEMDIIGWIEPPKYDATQQRLVWSILAKDHNAPKDESPTVNYNTFALGRNGYFELNLITTQDVIEQDKTHAHTMLAALNYNKDKHYSDFAAGSDRVAEYGIAALVAGVAAKKLGLLAVIGVFLAKGAKILIVAAALLATKAKALFQRLFGKKTYFGSDDEHPPSAAG